MSTTATIAAAVVFVIAAPASWPQGVSPVPPIPDVTRPLEVPEGLDQSRRHPSDERRFIVSIHSMEPRIRLNRIHNWTVTVLTAEGQPVEQAEIRMEGGMPAHNHGFPTEPRVTKPVGFGTYLIEGVKFNMTGWWEFVFDIRSGDVADRVRFNVVVEE